MVPQHPIEYKFSLIRHMEQLVSSQWFYPDSKGWPLDVLLRMYGVIDR
jgi:hypothetical protein